MRKALLLAVVLVTFGALYAVWSYDDGGGIDVRPPDVEVDTPALREAKARIGMEDCAPGDGEPVEGGLPELTLPCLGGGTDVELSSLRGPMVINLWASWCGPCEEEMPVLQAFHEQYADRVAVLGVDNQDVYPGRALALAERTGATYPSLVDVGGEVLSEEAFAVARRGLPAFVFIDEEGKVVGSTNASGGVESIDQLEDLVADYLGIEL
ncbi:Thiol-disulfide isomerase or thioredoxin [Nocardioides alpinus]|uniref:Thiol-disulfide isomerase or thioredoxin n=1 Tax=Nocardioides alpinus TaxID=748909 RepID=A0A1I0ZAS9_9ACTN|nr:TlpA disulfide reductase family protein [Nocardioides alpinus]PKH40754.1 TlpA family protein disulfide reductase [Nocardioides alpinus]SFB22216.1 Thiol-disulfide isomerase or thioredoxin [Nocardioides alpinus]